MNIIYVHGAGMSIMTEFYVIHVIIVQHVVVVKWNNVRIVKVKSVSWIIVMIVNVVRIVASVI
jgi:hypothetical protein